MVSIYVLPTEAGLPPRAIVGAASNDTIEGVVVTWSADLGAWTLEGLPIPNELGEAITDHAKSLGVDWD